MIDFASNMINNQTFMNFEQYVLITLSYPSIRVKKCMSFQVTLTLRGVSPKHRLNCNGYICNKTALSMRALTLLPSVQIYGGK